MNDFKIFIVTFVYFIVTCYPQREKCLYGLSFISNNLHTFV